jgi:hypothetical protein
MPLAAEETGISWQRFEEAMSINSLTLQQPPQTYSRFQCCSPTLPFLFLKALANPRISRQIG